MMKRLLLLREEEDPTEVSAPPVRKSPDSALIGGLVAGCASIALLALIFYVLWRTRKSQGPYLTPHPEKIVPNRDGSRISSRSVSRSAMNVENEPDEERKTGGGKRSRANSIGRTRTREPSISGTAPV